jgi:hypothetical protein
MIDDDTDNQGRYRGVIFENLVNTNANEHRIGISILLSYNLHA